MVFGNCGVLTEITKDKGFVEMSGIDPDTSTDIGEVFRTFNFNNISLLTVSKMIGHYEQRRSIFGNYDTRKQIAG